MFSFLAILLNCTDRAITSWIARVQFNSTLERKIKTGALKGTFLVCKWMNNTIKSNSARYHMHHRKNLSVLSSFGLSVVFDKGSKIAVFLSIVMSKRGRWPPLFITFLSLSWLVTSVYQVSSTIYVRFFYYGITLNKFSLYWGQLHPFLIDRLGNGRGASQFSLIWQLPFSSRQVIRNFINSYLLSFLNSYNKIIKSELFHPGCGVIKLWDVTHCSKFDFRLKLGNESYKCSKTVFGIWLFEKACEISCVQLVRVSERSWNGETRDKVVWDYTSLSIK